MLAQPVTGTPAVPTLYVQFKDGLAETEDEQIIEMMLRHKGMDRQFIGVEEGETAPYEPNAQAEPVHIISEIENGKVVKRMGKPIANPKAEEINKRIADEAKKIALDMLPGLVQEVLKQQADTKTEEVEETVESKETVESEEETPVTKKKKKK